MIASARKLSILFEVGNLVDVGYDNKVKRSDRLLAIVLELQGRDVVLAESLADIFEVTLRTIYRDMQALVEAGVPIVSAPGQGYWLMEGYFLPPLSFSTDEATLLLLGSEVMAQSFDDEYKKVAQSAAKKIDAVLDDRLRNEVNYLKENIRFFTIDSRLAAEQFAKLQLIRSSVMDRYSVSFQYFRPFAKDTSRKLDPYGLYQINGSWMVAGHCHLRETKRMFRLDRMEDLKVLRESFERKDYEFERVEEARALNISLEFAPEVTRQVREKASFFITSLFEDEAGVRVELQVRALEDVLAWILSWGSKVKVLSPESLKDKVRDEAKQMLQSLEN